MDRLHTHNPLDSPHRLRPLRRLRYLVHLPAMLQLPHRLLLTIRRLRLRCKHHLAFRDRWLLPLIRTPDVQ